MVSSRKQRQLRVEPEPTPTEGPTGIDVQGGGVVGEMGARLRAARKARGLSTGQLAEAAGVTRGFLSQLERGMTSASIATTVRICTALGIRVGELFEPAHADVVRKDLRPLVEYTENDAVEYLITPPANSRIEAYDLTIAPGGRSGDPRSVQALAGFIYVLEGQIAFQVGETVYDLSAGDSLSYSPSEPLCWRNTSHFESARVIWVLTG
jgi:transcriptional regulator with XRE-family HTH domain